MDRPGYKTTEFWMTALAQLVGAFAASGLVGDEHVLMRVAGMLTMALTGMGYSVSRGKVKSKVGPGYVPPGAVYTTAPLMPALLLGLLLSGAMPAQSSVTVNARAGSIVSFLWPKAATDGLPVCRDGRPTQVDELPGDYNRVTYQARFPLETVRLIPGVPATADPSTADAAIFLPFRAHILSETGADPWAMQPVKVRTLASGPHVHLALIEAPRLLMFTAWYPGLGAGTARIVARNGVVDPSGGEVISDLTGEVEIHYGDRRLHHEEGARHHFGRLATWRFAVSRSVDGVPAVSMQRSPWPEPRISLPLDLYASLGLIPGYHESVAAESAPPRVGWGTGINDSIHWPLGGSSGGGKSTLAPLPRHDVRALHNPDAIADALWAADHYPYPYFFTDVGGKWISPLSHPRGWCDMNTRGRHTGVTFKDFGPVRFGDLMPSPHTADAAHLPNPFVVPAILTGDPFYVWAKEGHACGVAMQSRGLSGGWRHRRTGEPLTPVSEGVKNSRGPTGKEGWIGRQERALGWGLWERLDAVSLTGSPVLLELSRTALVIARGHYLDSAMHDSDEARAWGYHCAPWWWEAVHKDGHGRPPFPALSEGDAAYVTPKNAINGAFCTDARASWQDAFIAMAFIKAERRFSHIPGLEWVAELGQYAEAAHKRMGNVASPTEYCWPTRNDSGWLETAADVNAGWLTDASDLPSGGRVIGVDADGLNPKSGYSYVGYNNVALLRLPHWQKTFKKVVRHLPIEWRITK